MGVGFGGALLRTCREYEGWDALPFCEDGSCVAEVRVEVFENGHAMLRGVRTPECAHAHYFKASDGEGLYIKSEESERWQSDSARSLDARKHWNPWTTHKA